MYFYTYAIFYIYCAKAFYPSPLQLLGLLYVSAAKMCLLWIDMDITIL